MYIIQGSLFIMSGMILYFVGRAVFIVIRLMNQKQVYWLTEFMRILFALYLCMVISVTLFPIPVGIPSDHVNVYSSINFIPLKSIIYNISQVGFAYNGDVQFMIGLIAKNVGGNILLLLPLGFLAPILWNYFKQFNRIALLGLATSISIELLQFLEPKAGGLGRISDIDDVICNVFGSIIGYYLYKLVIKIVNKLLNKNIAKIDF